MSEAAALPADRDPLGPPERLHPLYLLTGLGQSLKGAWGLIAGGAVLRQPGALVDRICSSWACCSSFPIVLAVHALAQARISGRRA